MHFITPYDDEKMVYDYESHQYKLTLAYVKKSLGIDLPEHLNTAQSDDPQAVAQSRLDQISDEIYSYIYAHTNNEPVVELYACKLESTRNIICKAMKEQLAYELVSGSMAMFSGVNIKTGQVVDQEKLRKTIIGFNAQKALDRIVPEMGVALTYQGDLFTPIGFKYREGY